LLSDPVPQQYEDTSARPNARTGKNSNAIYIYQQHYIYCNIWSTYQLYIRGMLRGYLALLCSRFCSYTPTLSCQKTPPAPKTPLEEKMDLEASSIFLKEYLKGYSRISTSIYTFSGVREIIHHCHPITQRYRTSLRGIHQKSLRCIY